MAKSVKDIIDQLEYGIDDVFGCPGGHKLDQYDKDQALKELEAIIESAKPLKREMGLGFSDVQNGYNSAVDDYEANLIEALYGKDEKR